MKKNENAHSVSSLLIDINTKCQYGNSEKTTREAKGDAVVRAIARPPVLWPGLQILASTRYVSGSLPCSKTYSFCRFSDFPLSLKTDTQHSMWKAWARLHKFFTTSKCFVAKKNPNLQFYIRPPLRMDSFGKPKRRDEAKEISFKKFQKSATKHDTFVIKRQRQAFVRFLYHSMVLTTVKLSPNF